MRDHHGPEENEELDEPLFEASLESDQPTNEATDEAPEATVSDELTEPDSALDLEDELPEPEADDDSDPGPEASESGPEATEPGQEALETAEDELAAQALQVPPLEELEEALTENPVDRVPPFILASAVIGLVVGLFVWGSLVMSVMSSTEGVISDLGSGTSGAFGAGQAELVLDCGDTEAPPFLSAEQRAALQERCASPTPEAEAEETPPPDPSLNRADCDAIRGTDYRSVEERQWFLDNCVEG